MGSYNKKNGRLALAALLTLALGQVQASSYTDVLDLPAAPSVLASRSPLLDITRAGERLVSVGQRGHILYSDDDGQSWQQASVPVSADLNALSFPTPTQGWAVGNDGVILHSADAGATWSKQLDGRQIGALMVNHYAALAQSEPTNQQWLQLRDEGQRLIAAGADQPLFDVWFADENTGFAVGVFNLILHTRDGGRSWVPFHDRTDNPQGLHLTAIASTGDALYIVGEQGLLRKWQPAEQRFATVETPYQGTFFGVIGQPGEVWVYGLRGHAFSSRDGGHTWQQRTSHITGSFSAAMIDAQGRYHLFTQAGQQLIGDASQDALQLLPLAQPLPVAGVAQAKNGSWVLVGARGALIQPVQ